MTISIYESSGELKAAVSPNESSTQSKEIQGDNILALSFVLPEYISFDVDDYTDFLGERYRMTERYRPKETSSHEWSYDLKLYGIESLLKNILVRNTVDGDDNPVFTLTAPAKDHLKLIVGCLNESHVGGLEWNIGLVADTDNIVIDYRGTYCNEALKELASKTGTEWWINSDSTVNLCRCEYGEALSLGYRKGLVSIEPDRADNVKFYTRLYPIGSSRNIDREKYGSTRLRLPDGKAKRD